MRALFTMASPEKKVPSNGGEKTLRTGNQNSDITVNLPQNAGGFVMKRSNFTLTELLVVLKIRLVME